MKKIGYHLLGALLRGLFYLTEHVPNAIIYAISKYSSSLFMRFSQRYQRKISRNLRIAFGASCDSSTVAKISGTLAQNLGLNFAETLVSSTSKKKALLNSIQVHGIEHLDHALAAGKGVIAFSAHIGNFTLIGPKMSACGYAFNMLVKDPRYTGVAEAFHIIQEGQGGKFIYVEPWEKALRQILASLRKNEVVCMLADEKKTKSDIFVDFFGYPAPTAPGPAVLSLRTGAPLLPVFIIRGDDGHHHIHIGPLLEFVLNGDRTSDIHTIVASYTRIIEDFIKRYPDQWFWINDRWNKKVRDSVLGSA
jgi:Kdo2-lipid IVA lauroyltransferase/acyltransferase